MIKITGIILAGGKSSRMGTDKSLMMYKGNTLLQHAINTVSPLCNQVIISSRENDYSFTGCEVWKDELEIQAPIVGIYSCLKRSTTELNIVFSCDLPLVNTQLFEFLFSQALTANAILPFHHNNLIEPLCGLYNRSSIPILKQSIENNDLKLKNSLKKLDVNAVLIDKSQLFYSEKMFLNVNSISEFNLL